MLDANRRLAKKLGLDQRDPELEQLIRMPRQDFEQQLQKKLENIPFYHKLTDPQVINP